MRNRDGKSRGARQVVRAGNGWVGFDPLSTVIVIRFPSDLFMLKDEPEERRRTGCWSRSRSEHRVLREIRAQRALRAAAQHGRRVSRPRGRHARGRQVQGSRGSPDDSDLPPEAPSTDPPGGGSR